MRILNSFLVVLQPPQTGFLANPYFDESRMRWVCPGQDSDADEDIVERIREPQTSEIDEHRVSFIY